MKTAKKILIFIIPILIFGLFTLPDIPSYAAPESVDSKDVKHTHTDGTSATSSTQHGCYQTRYVASQGSWWTSGSYDTSDVDHYREWTCTSCGYHQGGTGPSAYAQASCPNCGSTGTTYAYKCDHTNESLGTIYLNKDRSSLSITTSSDPKFTINGYIWSNKASGSLSTATATGVGTATCTVTLIDNYSNVISTVTLNATMVASDFYTVSASADISTSATSWTNRDVTVTCTPDGDEPATYQWYRDDTLIPGATSQSFVANLSGRHTYKCVSTSVNGAEATTNDVVIYYDGIEPTASLTVTKADNTKIWQKEDVTVSLNATDSISGVASRTWTVTNLSTGATVNVPANATSVTLSADGVYEGTVVITDNAGNSTTKTFNDIDVCIDKSVPAASITSAVASDTWSNDSMVGLTGHDSATHISEGSLHANSVSYTWTVNGIAYTSTGADNICKIFDEGEHAVVLTITTASGISDTASYIVKIDRTAPTINISCSDDNTVWLSDDTTLTVNTTDAMSGVADIEWSRQTGPSWGYIGDGASVAITTPGDNTYKVEVTDNAGNRSEDTINVKIDKTVPTPTVNATPDHLTNTDVILTCTDTTTHESNVTYQWYKNGTIIAGATNSTYTVTEDCINDTFSCTVTTGAGLSGSGSVVVNIDKTKPVLNETHSNDWTNTNVIINLSVTDVNPDKIYCNGTLCSENFVAASNGTYEFYAVDLAGNESDHITVEISCIDKVRPVLTATYDDTVWTNEWITVSLTVTDEHPDKVYCDDVECSLSYNAVINDTYEFYAVDLAGNMSDPIFVTITHIDNTKPVVSLSYDDTIWSNTGIVITVTNTEAHPDKVYCNGEECGLSVTATENGTYEFYSTDLAGNESDHVTATITHIDKTAPTLTVDFNDIWTNGTLVATLNGVDDHIDRYYCNGSVCKTPYVVTANGTYTFTVKDLAGNESDPVSITATKIDKNDPVLNIAVSERKKSNETITLSFNDEALDKCTEYFNGTIVGDIDFDGATEYEATRKLTQNGTYTYTVKDLAGNIKEYSHEVSGLVFAFELDETSDYTHTHRGSTSVSGYCYTDPHTTTNYSPCTVSWTWGKDFNNPDPNAGGWVGNHSKCGAPNEYVDGDYGNIPKPASYSHGSYSSGTTTVYHQNCGLETGEVIGTATLRKDLSEKYYLYIESDLTSHCEIVSYAWTGTPTAMSIDSAEFNVNAVNGATTPRVEVKDFGEYECNVTWRDTKTEKEFTYNYYYTVEDYDLEPPTVEYHVTNITKDTNTIEFTFEDNFSLKSLSENGNLLTALNGKTATATITLSRNEHDLVVSDMIGNTYEFTVNANYLRDNTDYTSESSYKDISITAYPITYEYDNGVKAHNGQIQYALKTGSETSEFSTSGIFKDIYKNGDYIIVIKDDLGNECEYSLTITTLTEKLPVTYIDAGTGEDTNDKGEILGTQVLQKSIGSSVGGHELGTDPAVGRYYEGYYFTTSTTAIVTAGVENKVYRYFKLKYYDVTYTDANGNVIGREKIGHGKRNTFTSIPTKESYRGETFVIDYFFECWVDASGNEVDLTNVTSNLSLSPKFREVRSENVHRVTFYPDYENSPSYYIEEEVGHGMSVTPPSATKADYEDDEKTIHYVFKYWKLADGTQFDDFDNITEDITVFAEYFENLERKIKPAKDVSKVIEKKAEPITVEPDLSTLTFDKSRVIKDDVTPTNGFMKFYKDNEQTIKTVGKTVGISAVTLALLELLSGLLSGFTLIQLILFTIALLKKHRRYIQGAWMTDDPNMKYVDRYGREITRDELGFKFKDTYLNAIDVNDEIKNLNNGRITYSDFEKRIKESDVYTVMSSDVMVECENIKNTFNTKVHGFSITAAIKNFIRSAGEYRLKVKTGGKEFIYNISVALNGRKI